MIIGSLNIRRGGSLLKRKRISKIIKEGNAEIFLIQESKLNKVDHNLVKLLWNREKVGWSYSSSTGNSGGITTLWKEESVEEIFSFKGEGFLGVKLCIKDWVLAGDFNAVCIAKERRGRYLANRKAEMEVFSQFVEICELRDVPCKGKCFSWFSGDGHAANKEDWGPKPFMFNNAWFKDKNFLPFIESEWKKLKVIGRNDFVLKEKLRLLKDSLRRWNVSVFGKVDLEIKEGLEEINELDEFVSWCSQKSAC
ncbi:uncharacterized protein LOC131659750 [Vicia villosa]|uniref:uncharacterized protein LOC131659750 n=1 Tax=Vicia villosa TaxID=3911 RepID=UPI00273A8A3C|nr:uncharacterized protein LOC131659750 [Vicia villosa]